MGTTEPPAKQSETTTTKLRDGATQVVERNSNGRVEPALLFSHVAAAGEAEVRLCLSPSTFRVNTRLQLPVIISSLAVSVFLCALDETIIVTAIPRITDDFRSINDIGWYGSAYFMTFAAFQLTYGKLFTFFPIKTVFLISIAIFKLGSLICGVAPSSAAFIVGRAIAGLGSAGINAGFIVIIAAILPLERRPIFVASYTAMYGLAAIAAPLLGGALTKHATWRWCFYINLPIGGSAMLAIFLFADIPDNIDPDNAGAPLTWKEKANQMDLLGTSVLIPTIVCLLLALQWGGSVHNWDSTVIIVLLVAFGVGLLSFIAIQFWKKDSATVPPRIISQRSVACSACYVFLASGAVNIFQYFLPLYFQTILSTTPLQSGINLLPLTLTIALFSFLSGLAVQKTGYYTPLMILGVALLTTRAFLITTWTVSSTPPSKWIGYQIVLGIGAGLGIQQAHTAAQTVLEAADVPTGAVVLIFAHVMGSAVGIPVAQNLFTGRLVEGLERMGVGGLGSQGGVLGMGATGLREVITDSDVLEEVLVVYSGALRMAFLCGGVLAGIAVGASLGMEWKSIKKGRVGTASTS